MYTVLVYLLLLVLGFVGGAIMSEWGVPLWLQLVVLAVAGYFIGGALL